MGNLPQFKKRKSIKTNTATNKAKKREDEIKTKINISVNRTESSRGKSAVKKHTANAAGNTFVGICCGDFNFELIKKGFG